MKRINVSPNRGFTWVDADVFVWASKINWHATKKGYIFRDVGLKREYLHRLVMRASKGTEVHHRKSKRHNCRKDLIVTSRAGNAQSFWSKRAHDRGVNRRLDTGKWRAYIYAGGKHITLGCYLKKSQAIRAYNQAAKRFWGPLAHQNR